MASLDAAALFRVPNLVAVITGGGTGLGLMMAKALAHNGAHRVYILGRRRHKLDEAAQASPHGNIVPLQCDVTSKDALAAAAAHVERETGYINLLVANAGIMGPQVGGLKKDASVRELQEFLWNWDAGEFSRTYEVNNTAVFFTAVAFLGLLDKGNQKGNVEGVSSQIIVTASIAGLLRIVITGFAYVTSKAAAVSMTKALATVLAPHGIRANAIAPGIFPSEMTEGTLLSMANEDGGVPGNFIPAGRFGTEEDIAGTTLYLASKAGAFCDGNVILTDGGRVSIVPASY